MKLFIFGLGYSGVHIAQAAKAAGFSVYGTCRSHERCGWLKSQGIEACSHTQWGNLDFDRLGITHMLSSIPPQAGYEEPDLGIRPGVVWQGYLSTTGVYGDWGGEWVDEDSPLRGATPRLAARTSAEQRWRGQGAHIFRLAGIYGPGRSVLDEIRNGTARRIDKPGQLFSRIHVADIAQVVLASMQKPHAGAIYNVCDDEAAAARTVVEYGCELLGAPLPPLVPYEQARLSVMAREFYSANRRVKNDRIKNELDVGLHYPSYREGLAALAKVNVA